MSAKTRVEFGESESRPTRLKRGAFCNRARQAVASWPESITLAILVLAFAVSAWLSPYFLDAGYLLESTTLYMEIGLLALAMTLVIVSGNIDLSVASGLALTAVVAAALHTRLGAPMLAVIPMALIFGCLLGLFNGLLIVKLRLPSLAVTLGTLAFFRGLAQIIAGDHSIGGLPGWFVGVDYIRIGGWVPLPLAIFAALSVVFGLLLQKTVFGRCIYAIGANETAARYSGMPVDRVKLLVFVLSGLMMGIGGLMMLSRLTVARHDLSIGGELAVITAVVLGGVHISGGSGRIPGVVFALFTIGFLNAGMGVAEIASETQLVIIGSLLLVAVLLGNIVRGR